MYDLHEKVVLITGGGKGIGFSCAKELLQAGAKGVTIANINETRGQAAVNELTKTFGAGKALFVKTDVAQSEQFEAALKATIIKWNCIDILINNAGIFDDAHWELEISINVNGVIHGTLLGLQYMGTDKGGKGGVIVNVASAAGLQQNSLYPIYGPTKSFVVGFSHSLGMPYHYNRTGVRIMVVCPTGTDTNPEYRTLFPHMQQEVADMKAKRRLQRADNVSRGVVSVIMKGESGSIWVSENDEDAYEIILPHRKTLRKL